MVMKYKCGMIQDLLPLYADNVTSQDSVDAIKQHIQECDECRKLYDNINNTSKQHKNT
jgi:predicted anti-sigma-YlaC factor YlaD